MRSITTCPACQTEFYVTAEQLEQYHGKVRCGECSHVFDATIDKEQFEDTNETHAVQSPIDQTSLDQTVASGVDLDLPAPLVDPSNQTTHATLSGLPSQEIRITQEIQAARPSISDAVGDYVPTGKKSWGVGDARHSRPKWVTVVLGFTTFVLLCAALFQVLFAYRSHITALHPQTMPFFKTVCLPFKCTVPLPQDIARIVIDDSDIQEDSDFVGALRFTSTLKNNAGFVQAYPNIELTLTDLNDEALLRRNLSPSDYLPPSVDPKKGFESGQSLTINLALMAKDVLVSGYRVAITY